MSRKEAPVPLLAGPEPVRPEAVTDKAALCAPLPEMLGPVGPQLPRGRVCAVGRVLCKLSGHAGSLLFKTTNPQGRALPPA